MSKLSGVRGGKIRSVVRSNDLFWRAPMVSCCSKGFEESADRTRRRTVSVETVVEYSSEVLCVTRIVTESIEYD